LTVEDHRAGKIRKISRRLSNAKAIPQRGATRTDHFECRWKPQHDQRFRRSGLEEINSPSKELSYATAGAAGIIE
jgi:hypothetical protein